MATSRARVADIEGYFREDVVRGEVRGGRGELSLESDTTGGVRVVTRGAVGRETRETARG